MNAVTKMPKLPRVNRTQAEEFLKLMKTGGLGYLLLKPAPTLDEVRITRYANGWAIELRGVIWRTHVHHTWTDEKSDAELFAEFMHVMHAITEDCAWRRAH